MAFNPRIDILGAALADQSRVRMLCELMDGRAHTGKELASVAGIAPNTASDHLAKLRDIGMLSAMRSGRFVYYRLAGAEVAEVLERMSALSPTDHLYRGGSTGVAPELVARTCYNHIAGRLGVLIASRLEAMGWVRGGELPVLTPEGRARLQAIGVLPAEAKSPTCKSCLDWSERRRHLSGPLGTAIFDHALAQGCLRRRSSGRALVINDAGQGALLSHFGISNDMIHGAVYDAETSPVTEPI